MSRPRKKFPKGYTTLSLDLGTNEMTVDGKKASMDSPEKAGKHSAMIDCSKLDWSSPEAEDMLKRVFGG